MRIVKEKKSFPEFSNIHLILGFKMDLHVPTVKYDNDSPDGEISKIVRPWWVYFCSLRIIYNSGACFSNKETEDEVAMARDIAEFERNKHLARPCNTLDGFNVNRIRK